MKRFLDLASFSRGQILDLLELAQSLQDKPQPQSLAGKVLGLVFFNPSLRTLASFQSGMARLGGSCFVINPGIEAPDGAIHVIGELGDGTNAQPIAVPATNVYPIPGDLSFEEAAAVPVAAITAL